nr:IS66 family transposase [Cupriavidus taiwanensis]
MPGPPLPAHFLVGKCRDHFSLYWEPAIYARDCVKLSRSILSNWIGQPSALFCLDQCVSAVRDGASKIHRRTLAPVLQLGNGKT